MPETVVAPRPASRIIPSLAVMLVMTATILITGLVMADVGRRKEAEKVFLRGYRPPYELEARLSHMMDYVRNSSEANDVVFLGGSGSLMGVDPIQFDRETGLKSHNLGSWGVIKAGGFLEVFRDYLEHHPKPRVLVYCLDLKADSGTENADELLLYDRFCSAYKINEGRARLPHAFPFYVKEGIRSAFGSATGRLARSLDEKMGAAWEEGQSYHSYGRSLREHRGHYVPPSLAKKSPSQTSGLPFCELPDYWAKIRLMAELCRRLDITIVFRVTPLRDDFSFIDDRFVAKTYARHLDEELESLAKKFPRMSIGRPALVYYQEDLCWDLMHLNQRGASQFTASIAGEVLQILANPEMTGPKDRLDESSVTPLRVHLDSSVR